MALRSLLLFLMGCADESGIGSPRAGDGTPDAGAPGFFGDAAMEPSPDEGEQGPTFEGAPLWPGGADPGAPPGRDTAGESPEDDRASCYDGMENDDADPDGVDCDDPGCRTLPSCCIGRGDCCGRADVSLPSFDLDALMECTGDPARCVGGVAFGSPSPFVDDGGEGPHRGLALGGDGEYDSGLLFPTAVDLRTHRVEVEADLLPPGATCTDAGCLESITFGFGNEAPRSDQRHVQARVALSLSGARREVALLRDGVVLARWPSEGAATWTLALDPEGGIDVLRDGVRLPAAPFSYAPHAGAQLMLWGHSRNPSATGEDGARLQGLRTRVELCDMPRGWGARERLALRVGGMEGEATRGASPSMADDGQGTAFVAWQGPEGIFVARRPEGFAPFELAASDLTPVVTNTEKSRYEDPELVWRTDAFWLYLTERDASDDARLVLARGDATASSFAAPEALVLPDLGSTTRVAAPTLSPLTGDTAQRWAMVAEVEYPTTRRLVAFASADAVTWEGWSEVDVAPLRALGYEDTREPSLVVHGDAYQLYASVRRGARWSIALMASDDLVHWRLVDARVLLASEGPEGLGVRGADAVDRGRRIELLYTGIGATSATLLRTERAATDDATR